MGLIYEGDGYFPAHDVKKFDAEKFDRFIDNLAHDIDRYNGDARALENGYGKYYHNSTYVGKAANASKEFIDRKQFEKFHVESKDIQRELFNRCLGVQEMFKNQVDPSPKARIDSETLELNKREFRDYFDELEHEGYDIECMARELENDYGKYGNVTQPNYRSAMMAYDEFCGHGGFWDKCQRKFEAFNEDARQYMKRAMIKEHSYDLQKDMKSTAAVLEGMKVFKSDVHGQSVWVNALNTSNAVVDPEKLAADIREIIKLSGIKYNKNTLVDANIIKEATELALLNCKSKGEKAALMTCSNAMIAIVPDAMSAELFLDSVLSALPGIVMGIVGFIAETNPVAIILTLLYILLLATLVYASSRSDHSKSADKEKEIKKEAGSKTATAGNSSDDDDDNDKEKKNKKSDNNEKQYDTKERIDNAKKIAKEVQENNGKPPKGYQGGRTYKNFPKNPGDQKLPEGNTYKEYDVNPKQPGVNRGTERIVIGSDGSVWYTNDHYHTFYQLW